MRLARSILLLLFVAATAGAATTTFPPINYRTRTLPNGLQIYTVQDRSTPTVAIHVWYRVGSKDDPQGRSGFAHLFEHMMFKSTKNMPSEMMDRLTEDVGGYNNATTFDDSTPYYEVVPSNYLETLLWAEAERMGSLTVDEGNFKSERDVVKEEFRFRILAPPYGRLFYAIDRNSFVKHPYKRPGIGSIEELDAATIEDVRSFHRTFYRPDNAILIVVGDFEQQQVDTWIDKYFTPIPKPTTEIPRVNVEEPARTAERVINETSPNVPLPGVVLTYLAPPAAHADAVPLEVAATLLGEGESSRLHEAMVRTGIAVEVNVYADLRQDLGLFTFLAIMGSEKKPADGEQLLRAGIKNLIDKPVSASELEKAKNLILTREVRERETSNGKAFALGQAIVLQGDASAVNKGLSQIQAVTAADVQRVARKYFGEGKALVINYTAEPEKAAAAPQAGGNQ
ncbi:MAG TPA: pitrilysin family protein [Thermoanaerobaculia bacterium]